VHKTLLVWMSLFVVACGAPAPETLEQREENSAPILAEDDGCDVVDAWIAVRFPDELPQSYADVARLPPNYRRGVFNVIGAERQAELVQEQAARYLRGHPGLSAEERVLLRDVETAITPAAFADGPGSPAYARAASFEHRALAVFGGRLETEVFTLLRAPRALLEEPAKPACECNSVKDDCILRGGHCKYQMVPCDSRPSGCGPLSLDSCNGICVRW
jgi:hypothetical protein